MKRGAKIAQISVSNLSFSYDGSIDTVFENISFNIDTQWKLGFIGRNGKGKTTFLNLLLGKYSYQGEINAPVTFDYFPYSLSSEQKQTCAMEWMQQIKPNSEFWRVSCELSKMNADSELLFQPFSHLSSGQQTKVLLGILFSGEHDFLLIDEPTNHLDQQSRDCVKMYLQKKKGFILVSHDRDLLDACVDHILALNKKTIEVQQGNFSSWWENKSKKDSFQLAENTKHSKEIASMKKAASQYAQWGNKSEKQKIGKNPIKNHDRSPGARAYIGAKSKKLQRQKKQLEHRIDQKIKTKEGLLQDVEEIVSLKVYPLTYTKDTLLFCNHLSLCYGKKAVVNDLSFDIHQGDRIFLHGENGCRKSTLIKAICSDFSDGLEIQSDNIHIGSNLIISYIQQDTSWIQGSIDEFCKASRLDKSLFLSILYQLGMDRNCFSKHLEDFSPGQKKKVLIASSLSTQAHLYIGDEPLNYIDVFTRMQIESVLMAFKLTMIVVEHDIYFQIKLLQMFQNCSNVKNCQQSFDILLFYNIIVLKTYM